MSLMLKDGILIAKETAVIIVDMQNDFCHNDGILARQGTNLEMIQGIVPKMNSFLQEVRSRSLPVIWVTHTNSDNTMSPVWLQKRTELGRSIETVCRPDSWGAEIYDKLTISESDITVVKHRHSAFYNTQLETILKAMNIRNVIIGGISTNVCVDATARDAYARDFFVYIAKDLVGSTLPEFNDSFLENANTYFATVTDVISLCRGWGGGS